LAHIVLELRVGPDRKALLIFADGGLKLVFLLQRVALVAQLLRLGLPCCRIGILLEFSLQRRDVARKPRIGPLALALLVLRDGLGNPVLAL
jgi:hypothetical protein